MNKLLFLFPIFLFAKSITLPYTFSLKKDEIIKFNISYKKFTYPLSIRWTLYKNDYLVVLYKFDNFPRQVMLRKIYPLDSFKIKIARFPTFYPYLFIKFKDFNDKIATFEMFLFNPKDVGIEKVDK
jgi:hypothetical protein